MYINIKIKFLENKITVDEAAARLGLHRNTLANKINGKAKFYIDEIEQLQQLYFPDCSIEYLCQRSA